MLQKSLVELIKLQKANWVWDGIIKKEVAMNALDIVFILILPLDLLKNVFIFFIFFYQTC